MNDANTSETNSTISFPVNFDNVTLSAKIIRANGEVQDLGILDSSKFNRFQKFRNNMRLRLLNWKHTH